MSEVTEARKECNKKVKKFRRVLDICDPAGYEPSAVERNYWKNYDACHKALLDLMEAVEDLCTEHERSCPPKSLKVGRN